MTEIEQAIADHEKKKSAKRKKIALIVVGVLALGFGLLYGCACMMSPPGQCM